ncbi:hypothetical protein N8D56_27100 (plasmid) [Devosia sp. A8/3-2]|nr:hypothetical protein N8D56_27100 [Devosia sp. A8/3-2]
MATVDTHGVPNVTPKEIFASHGDDRIVIADIAGIPASQTCKNGGHGFWSLATLVGGAMAAAPRT